MVFVSFLKRLFRPKTEVVPGTRQTGIEGEVLAAQYLTRHGLRVKERNWRCKFGELDLICRDGEEYVFVEVKASRRLISWQPEDRVNFRKQQKLKSLATLYRKVHAIDAPFRFDIVAVWWEDNKPQIRHIENVFPMR
jgi:putative endonuclease